MGELMRSQTLLEDKDRPGFFKDYHKSVRAATSNDVFNRFCLVKQDDQRVKFLTSEIPEVDQIDVKAYYRGKSEKEALEKKEEGNKAFIRKNNLEALQLYNYAVVKAPVPFEENADPKKMTLYAICLANRSAALFHLKDYYYCIKDIDEALEHHYPKELKYKLYKRRGRLLVSFRRNEDARDSYRQALKWLDWAKMERDKRIEKQNEIQKWLRLFEGGKKVVNAPWSEVQLFPLSPDLAEGANNKFSSLSQKLEVKYENKSGRYVTAAEDIKPGDTLCVEKPYAAVLLHQQYGTHCQKCFLLTRAPIPCKTCSGVVFCSVECRKESYFHRIECPIMNLLLGSGMSINCFLALRMVTQTPLNEFWTIRDKLVDEDPKAILDIDEPYNGYDMAQIYNLVRHSERRTPEDFFHRALMAVFMLKALKKTKYFVDLFSDNAADSVAEAETFVGGLLLRFLQIVQFNAHEVSEFMLEKPRCLEMSSNESLGAAIYPTLALFNHDCYTAQVRYFCGTSVVTRAVRSLAKGQLVPENYGPSFPTKVKSQRRQDLADRYWFECACEACEKNWPTFREMDNTHLNFKCSTCNFPCAVHVETPVPFFQCEQCQKHTNILGALKNLQNSEQTFNAATREMQNYDLDKAETLLIENMAQLESSLYPPYKDCHLTQEALMKINLCKGNIRVKATNKETELINATKK